MRKDLSCPGFKAYAVLSERRFNVSGSEMQEGCSAASFYPDTAMEARKPFYEKWDQLVKPTQQLLQHRNMRLAEVEPAMKEQFIAGLSEAWPFEELQPALPSPLEAADLHERVPWHVVHFSTFSVVHHACHNQRAEKTAECQQNFKLSLLGARGGARLRGHRLVRRSTLKCFFSSFLPAGSIILLEHERISISELLRSQPFF